jgi:transcriptional regulator with XRE-family HTH domain
MRTPDPAGGAIHHLRLKYGIRQEALAFKADVTISALARIERGEVASPKIGTLRKIATALDMSLTELVAAVEQEKAE